MASVVRRVTTIQLALAACPIMSSNSAPMQTVTPNVHTAR